MAIVSVSTLSLKPGRYEAFKEQHGRAKAVLEFCGAKNVRLLGTLLAGEGTGSIALTWEADDYAAYAHTPVASPPVRPANWGNGNYKLTSARSTDPVVADNPQELCGVEGSSVDTAWQTTTGRPTTVIAVTDSGIEWCNGDIVDKIYLNRAALPLPEDAMATPMALTT